MVSFKPLWLQEKEVHNNLLEDVKQLSSSPNDQELYLLLQQIKTHLFRIPQAPSNALKSSFLLLKDALVLPDLLTHDNEDIKISVASCLSEVFRVSAPDEPYSDECMKQCLRRMVSSLEEFRDTSGSSYPSKLHILEVMEKGRVFILLLDLECEEYIQDLFKYLLSCVKSSSSPSLLSTIMSLLGGIIEESEASLVKSFVQLLFNVSFTCTDDVSKILMDRLLKVCGLQLELSLEQLESLFLTEGHEESIQAKPNEQEVLDVNLQVDQKGDEVSYVGQQGTKEFLPFLEGTENKILHDDQEQNEEHALPIIQTINTKPQALLWFHHSILFDIKATCFLLMLRLSSRSYILSLSNYYIGSKNLSLHLRCVTMKSYSCTATIFSFFTSKLEDEFFPTGGE